MKTIFEEENIILKELDYHMFPPKGTLMWINKTLYEVSHSCIFFDKNHITVEIFKIN